MWFHAGEESGCTGRLRVMATFSTVNHVNGIADEHGQNDDDKAKDGVVVHGVLLFSERREFVDDDIKALR